MPALRLLLLHQEWGLTPFSLLRLSMQSPECRAIRRLAALPRVILYMNWMHLAARWARMPMQPPFSPRRSTEAAALPYGQLAVNVPSANMPNGCRLFCVNRQIYKYLKTTLSGFHARIMLQPQRGHIPAVQLIEIPIHATTRTLSSLASTHLDTECYSPVLL